MIARVWFGATPARLADEYASYLKRTGASDLSATDGNRGVFVLRRLEGNRARFAVISLWESLEDVKAFAGSDVHRAVYYPEDERFLEALPPRLDHYDIVVSRGPDVPQVDGE